MKIYLKKVNNVLIPSLPEDEEKLARWRNGEILEIEIRKPRNLKFHRKFFALLNIAFDNQDRYDNFEAFRAEVIMRCGYFNTHIHLSGKQSFSPKSISFGAMDQMEFEKLYSEAINVIIKYFMPKANEETVNKMVEAYMAFNY
jgi:hypothetical protein